MRRVWLISALVAAVAVVIWGYFGTSLPLVIGCRMSGGTPTTEPTTLQLSTDPSIRPVPVTVATCMK